MICDELAREAEAFVQSLRPIAKVLALRALPHYVNLVSRTAGHLSLERVCARTHELVAWRKALPPDRCAKYFIFRLGVVKRFHAFLMNRGKIRFPAATYVRFDEFVAGRIPRFAIRDDLQQRVSQFLKTLRGQRHTWVGYRHDLWEFHRYLCIERLPLTPVPIVQWARSKLDDPKLSRMVGSVRRFLRYLAEQKRIDARAFQAFFRFDARSRLLNLLTKKGASAASVLRALEERPGRPQSVLTPYWKKFVALKQSLGYKYACSVRAYESLDRFLHEQGVRRISRIDRKLLRIWALEDMAKGSPRALHMLLSYIRSFFQYLVSRGVMERDPSAGLSAPRVPAYMPYIYTHEEIRKILQLAASVPPDAHLRARCYAMFHLLYATGLRVSELVRLKIADVDFKERILFVRKTKFRKDRLVPFCAKVAGNLQAYLKERQRRFGTAVPGDPLFTSVQYKHLATQTVRQMLWSLFGHLGYKRRRFGDRNAYAGAPCIHSFRHTFAVHRLLRWYREGADVGSKLLALSTYMGHSLVQHTTVYLTATAEILRQASWRFSRACERVRGWQKR